MDIVKRFAYTFVLILTILLLGCQEIPVKGMQEEPMLKSPTKPVKEDPVLGPQSQQSLGEQRVLVVAVRFPDLQPRLSLQQIRRRAVDDLNHYVREQSYGLTWVKADFRGWVTLPDSLPKYRIRPYNFEVDLTRLRKLIQDTMTAIENEVDFSQYHHMLIIPGAFTGRGKGYGMICLCANPGMLGTVRKRGYYYRRYVMVDSKGGKPFQGGISIAAENAHPGMFPYDFLYYLGGLYENRRLVPCQYDFERQSDPSVPRGFRNMSIYMGPWDIMSQMFVKKDKPSQGISSFTKIRLGWITANQVILVRPGETKYVFLSPLAKNGDILAVKIPLERGQYYLVENRQPIGSDRFLPDSGILVLKVNPDVAEGSGPVRVMDADPGSPHFSHATFRLDQSNRTIFKDNENNIAVIPLWSETGNQGVLVTSKEKSADALKAALMIEKLKQRLPDLKDEREKRMIEECIASFMRFDFKRSYEIAQQAF
jgi:hypothetical protein